MNKRTTILLFFLCASIMACQKDFTVSVSETGNALGDEEIEMKIVPPRSKKVLFRITANTIESINWGDGEISDATTGLQEHQYVDQYPYTITIRATGLKILEATRKETGGVTSLKIGSCPFLEMLNCQNLGLQMLSVKECISLKHLNCSFNQIQSLNVSEGVTLTSLNCEYNAIHSLDLSNNAALSLLNCRHNELTNLDVSNNTELKELNCEYNELKTLGVNSNPGLVLSCTGNEGLPQCP